MESTEVDLTLLLCICRGRLKVLVGQLSAGVGCQLPVTLTNVRLSITTDEQAAIIPHLHRLSHLHDLGE